MDRAARDAALQSLRLKARNRLEASDDDSSTFDDDSFNIYMQGIHLGVNSSDSYKITVNMDSLERIFRKCKQITAEREETIMNSTLVEDILACLNGEFVGPQTIIPLIMAFSAASNRFTEAMFESNAMDILFQKTAGNLTEEFVALVNNTILDHSQTSMRFVALGVMDYFIEYMQSGCDLAAMKAITNCFSCFFMVSSELDFAVSVRYITVLAGIAQNLSIIEGDEDEIEAIQNNLVILFVKYCCDAAHTRVLLSFRIADIVLAWIPELSAHVLPDSIYLLLTLLRCTNDHDLERLSLDVIACLYACMDNDAPKVVCYKAQIATELVQRRHELACNLMQSECMQMMRMIQDRSFDEVLAIVEAMCAIEEHLPVSQAAEFFMNVPFVESIVEICCLDCYEEFTAKAKATLMRIYDKTETDPKFSDIREIITAELENGVLADIIVQ